MIDDNTPKTMDTLEYLLKELKLIYVWERLRIKFPDDKKLTTEKLSKLLSRILKLYTLIDQIMKIFNLIQKQEVSIVIPNTSYLLFLYRTFKNPEIKNLMNTSYKQIQNQSNDQCQPSSC